MNNKFTLSRFQNVNYVKENLENLIENNLVLSRYKDDDPEKEIAYKNFKECYEFIMNNEEIEEQEALLTKIKNYKEVILDDGSHRNLELINKKMLY